MDCETCNDLLMDLLYDELDEVRAAAARKHLDGCASCRASWQRVSQGRAVASTLAPVTAPLPNAALLAAVESAARSNAERVSVGPADRPAETGGAGGELKVAPVVPLESAPRRVPTWLHRLGDLAMRREFAMAAMALLVIGFSMRLVPWHTPSAVEVPAGSTAPQVIPAQELPTEQRAAAPAPTAQAPSRLRMMNRPSAAARQQRIEGRPAASADEGQRGARGAAPASDGLLDDSVRSTGSAPRAGLAAPSDLRYRSAEENTVDRFNVPGSVAAADRDLGRALPPAPQPSAPAWRSAWNAGEDHRAQGNAEAAIASYRAALEGDPPEAERTRIAHALIGQLSRAGRVAEVEVVRARYLRPARDSASQVDDAQATSAPPSVPHVPTSVPHPSMQRPARRAMPAATNLQAY